MPSASKYEPQLWLIVFSETLPSILRSTNSEIKEDPLQHEVDQTTGGEGGS